MTLGSVVRTLEAARALAAASLFDDAADHIGRLGRTGYLAPKIRASRHLFAACSALVRNDGPAAERAFRRALRELPEQSRGADTLRRSRAAWPAMKDDEPDALDSARTELRRILTAKGRARLEISGRGSKTYRELFRLVFGWLMGISDSP